jgi:hypothetical protein
MDELLKWLKILTVPTIEKRRFFASKVMLFFDGFDAKNACEECVIPWDDDDNENDEQRSTKKHKTN